MSTTKKLVAVAVICLLVVGAYALLAPGAVEAKPPFPGLPCDDCPGTIKDPPCICHLIDCGPDDCAYVCNCW